MRLRFLFNSWLVGNFFSMGIINLIGWYWWAFPHGQKVVLNLLNLWWGLLFVAPTLAIISALIVKKIKNKNKEKENETQK